MTTLDGQGVGAGPLGNLLAESQDLRDGLRGNLGLEVLELVGLFGELTLDLLAEGDGLVNVASNAPEVLLTHATAGHGGGTNTDTAGGQSRLITGDGVLVAGNVDLLQNGLNAGTVEALGAQVQEDHVAVSAVRDELVAEGLELILQSLGVLDDQLLVLLELGRGSLLQSDSQSGDGVVVGATLVTREDGEVDGTLQVVHDLLASLVGAADALAEKDHGTTGPTERLVGGGGHDIGVLEGRRDDTSGDQTGDVGHVDNEVGTDLVSDLAHALVVDQTAVGGGTGDQALGAVELSIGLQSVVVNDAGLQVNAVGEGLEVSRDGRDPGKLVRNFVHGCTMTKCNSLLGGSLVAVGQVTTVGEVKTHQTLVRAHEGLVDLQVGRAATKALDVDTPLGRVQVEGLESTLLTGDLDGINVLVTTVVTGTRVTLRVLVAHGRAQSIEDGAGGEVLRGNQDDGLALTLDLLLLQDDTSQQPKAPECLDRIN